MGNGPTLHAAQGGFSPVQEHLDCGNLQVDLSSKICPNTNGKEDPLEVFWTIPQGPSRGWDESTHSKEVKAGLGPKVSMTTSSSSSTAKAEAGGSLPGPVECPLWMGEFVPGCTQLVDFSSSLWKKQ